MPKLFRDILAVDPIAHEAPQGPGNQESCQGYQASGVKRSAAVFHTAACLQRMPFSSQALLNTIPSLSGFTKRSPEQHGFVIKLHGKTMELLCSSKEEAEMWIDGIREAITMASHGCRQTKSVKRPCSMESLVSESLISETSTSPPSSHTTTPRSSNQSTDDSEQSPPGKGRQFPPLAPGTPPLHKQQPIAPLGFGGDIVRRNLSHETLPLAPGDALRATAAGANRLYND